MATQFFRMNKSATEIELNEFFASEEMLDNVDDEAARVMMRDFRFKNHEEYFRLQNDLVSFNKYLHGWT